VADLRSDLEQQAAASRALTADLAARDAALADQVEQLGKNKQDLEGAVAALRKDLENLLTTHGRLTEDLIRRDITIAGLEDKVKDAEAQANRLSEERDERATALQQLEDEVATLREDARRATHELEQRLANQQQDMAAQQATLAALRDAQASQAAGHQALAEALAQRDAAVADLQKALAEQTALAEKLRQEQQAAMDYAMLVRRVQADVSRTLPPDARVAVVSKGDSALVSLAGRAAGHFPQGEGGIYAGHHPADSGQAIALLEAQRSAGAEFLVFPSTAFWWLEHYGDFARHLDTHYPRVWKNENCQIYQLSRPDWSPLARRAPQRNGPPDQAPQSLDSHGRRALEPAGTAGLAPTGALPRPKTRMDADAYRALVSRIRATAGFVLPKEATAIVISRGDEDLLKLEGRSAWHYPQTEDGTYAGQYPADSDKAVSHLESLRSRGGRFLIVPGTASWWLDHYDGLRRHLEASADCLWKNDDCLIFRLGQAQAGAPPGAAEQTTLQAPGAGQGLAPDLVARVLAQAPLDRYDAWLEVNRWNARREACLRQRLAKVPARPILSVVMPVYNPAPQFLDRAIQTVCSQVYDQWELCIADDGSTDPEVHRLLGEWQSRDGRIKVLLRQENGNISRATNSAAELARGEFLVLMDHDDELEPDALGEVACYLAEHPDADVIYSDDDKIDSAGMRFAPQFKPSWAPELLLSYMYLSHLFVLRRSLYWRAGGMRLGFEGSQDYDLALRATELTCAVGHIPKVLYHWRVAPEDAVEPGTTRQW
jgi:hypothetical protein